MSRVRPSVPVLRAACLATLLGLAVCAYACPVFADPPGSPANLAATVGPWTCDLAWDAAEGVTWNVYRSATSGSGYTLLAEGLTAPVYYAHGYRPSDFFFVVTATAGDPPEESDFSNEVCAPATVGAPPPPTGLSAAAGETICDLTWDTASFVTWNVYRSATSGSGYQQIAAGLAAPAFRDSALTPQTYYYVVTASGANGASPPPPESDPSDEASATPTDNPPAPIDAQLTLEPDVYILSGAANYPAPPDFAGVNFYRSWSATGPFTLINPVPILNLAECRVKGPLPRATLYFRVSVLDATGHETFSTQALSVDPVNLVAQEPKLNPSYIAGAGSVSANGGEFLWGET